MDTKLYSTIFLCLFFLLRPGFKRNELNVVYGQSKLIFQQERDWQLQILSNLATVAKKGGAWWRITSYKRKGFVLFRVDHVVVHPSGPLVTIINALLMLKGRYTVVHFNLCSSFYFTLLDRGEWQRIELERGRESGRGHAAKGPVNMSQVYCEVLQDSWANCSVHFEQRPLHSHFCSISHHLFVSV